MLVQSLYKLVQRMRADMSNNNNQDVGRDDGGDGARRASSLCSGAPDGASFSNDKHGLVYCNNRLNMDDISVIGFDYDYTLCRYKCELQELIYNEAKNHLLEKSGYVSAWQVSI